MADIRFDGLGVALVTPFKSDLTIDYGGLQKVIEHVLEGGCDYLVVLGTTSESPTLSYEEKTDIAEFIKERTNGRVPLIIGIGGNNTTGVVNDISKMNLNGYSAILSVTPYYNKPTQEGLYQHFKAIAEASPLPILLYNVPGRTGVNLTAKTTLRLSKISNIYGVKEASGNLSQSEEIIRNKAANFYVISGDDALTYPLMRKGAKGVISVTANAFPKEIKKLVELCRVGQYHEAENLQNFLNPFIGHLFEDGNPAGVKSVLSKMGFIENVLRLPLVRVNEKLEEKLEKESKKISELSK
ncbi:MAG: 4-hydroxy-tetrahydrodipicolinate synthase [Muribaculaceae bacterium]|nr:4-hydroxy-tetrahydrodipicolinate synthase [Muribaculaceae bacterium]